MWNREFHRTERCIGTAESNYDGCGAIIVHQGNLIVKKIAYYKNGDIDECECSYGFECPKCHKITDIYEFYIPDDIKQTLLQDCVDNIKKKTRKK